MLRKEGLTFEEEVARERFLTIIVTALFIIAGISIGYAWLENQMLYVFVGYFVGLPGMAITFKMMREYKNEIHMLTGSKIKPKTHTFVASPLHPQFKHQNTIMYGYHKHD